MNEATEFLEAIMNRRIKKEKDADGFERIVTLKKEPDYQCFKVQEKMIRKFEKKPILDVGYHTRQKSRSKVYMFIIRRIMGQIVYPLFEKKRTAELFELFDPSIELHMEPIERGTNKRKGKVYQQLFENDALYSIFLSDNGKKIFSGIGGSLKKQRYHHGNFKDSGERIIDIHRLFAEILFFSTVKKYFCTVENVEDATYIQCCKVYDSFSSTVKEKLVLDDLQAFVCFKQPFLQNYLTDFFMIIAEDYAEDSAVYRFEDANYARSYETKKNLPKKITAAMDRSLFHIVFPYVEYDETVDLVKVRKLEEEFVSLNNVVFKKSRMDGYSLRFRRLGCHKSSGIYYPTKQCMCVDISHPDAFVHEFFHMLDYHYGTVSKKISFWDVYKKYVTLFVTGLSSTELEKLKKSIGRKNLQYYKRKTEVFARCGEIYISRILGIETSLVGKVDTFAYPDDEELNSLIQEYFSKFLQKEKEE